MATSEQPKVTIVGGGISGLTAALRLAQRGYGVTVYEEKSWIGGNLGAHEEHGAHYDVYSHMFSNFYLNFWDLAEGDLGLRRGVGEAFEPRSSFKYLEKGMFPHFLEMADIGSPASMWQNLLSGLAPPADILLWMYSTIDSLSYRADDDAWDKLSVEGFLATRPWDTPTVSDLADMTLMTIWSVHSSQVSMAAYRRFTQYRYPLPAPLVWLLTGDLHTKLMEPLRKKIEHYGGTIKTNTAVREVHVGEGAERQRTGCWIDALKLQVTKFNSKRRTHEPIIGTERTVKIDHEAGDAVILAVPPAALSILIETGAQDKRIVDKLAPISQVRRLAAEPIPVLYLYFKKKLPDIPKENVLLRGSDYDLTILDLSQIWHDDPNMKYHGQDRTVLALAASDYYALPAGNPEDDGQRMIWQLHDYIGVFSPGSHWGDQSSDIDWEKSYFEANSTTKLFVNMVGGKQWQPRTHYPEHISNLYFAGDCTVNEIRMATVESAVTSGLQAASAVWETHRLGEPIEIKIPDTYPMSVILALKTLMGPSAYAAKCWHDAAQIMPYLAKGETTAAKLAIGDTIRDVCILPYAMAVDWWQAVSRALLPGQDQE